MTGWPLCFFSTDATGRLIFGMYCCTVTQTQDSLSQLCLTSQILPLPFVPLHKLDMLQKRQLGIVLRFKWEKEEGKAIGACSAPPFGGIMRCRPENTRDASSLNSINPELWIELAGTSLASQHCPISLSYSLSESYREEVESNTNWGLRLI